MADPRDQIKDFGGDDISVSQHTPHSPELSTNAGSDVDDNYELYRRGAVEAIDSKEAKRVLRKIDIRIIPVLFVIYLLQYLDKNGLNYASVYGLQRGTHLHGQEYSWLSSIFYFGYLISQIPSGYALQRLPVGKVLACTTIVWGIIQITAPACYSFAGIATNRFFLGFTEAIVNPGFVLVMGMWYTTKEQPLRLETYYCTNGIATMFGGLIGYAVGHITTGLPRWMYVFLIFGACSLASGLWALWVLPDNPGTAKFLDESERVIAIERVAVNRQGIKNHHFNKRQVWQTLYDPKTWILFVMAVGAQVPNSAITSFISLIIEGFGYGTLSSQYLQIPGGAVQFAAILGGGIVCSWKRNLRCPTMIFANTVCIAGAAMLVAIPSQYKWARLVGLWLCFFQGLGFSMSLTMISSNVAGTTKKQLTSAILFIGYCVGNIIGPQTFKESEAPGYHSAYIAMLVGYTVKLLSIITLYAYMWSVNKKRDRELAANGGLSEEEEKAAIEDGMRDMTELDNKGFRYSL
ncbi:MFS transporter [Teratosphaeria nubilosa]|uniref:MFS transporter n=1 Tax=Teratosphaeria nubilosa TaxID=161662 RepID=A0A6G1L890_9PEZI|nr:MFS transporter [Teratosphaeria nubilosa]